MFKKFYFKNSALKRFTRDPCQIIDSNGRGYYDENKDNENYSSIVHGRKKLLTNAQRRCGKSTCIANELSWTKRRVYSEFSKIFKDLFNYINYLQKRMLFRSIEIIWNLLENGDKNKVADQLNSLVSVNQIREAFLQQLLQGCSNYDRQLR